MIYGLNGRSKRQDLTMGSPMPYAGPEKSQENKRNGIIINHLIETGGSNG